jgi:hypothetical protein
MRNAAAGGLLVLAAGLAACTPSPAPGGDPAQAAESAQAAAEPAPAASPEPAEPEHAPALPAPVSLPSAPGEAGVRAFVTEFMEARVRGDEPRARDFLSPTALEQYGQGGGDLKLTGSAGQEFTRWELLTLNAADASAWEVGVRLHPGSGTAVEETLFIGPGPDTSETQRAWIVRGATRS